MKDAPAFAPPAAAVAYFDPGSAAPDASLLPPVDDALAVRERIAEFLSVSELVVLTTVTASGWPVTHCMHFGSVTGENGQPVIYLFSKPGTRKLVNIAANPRVSLMGYEPHNKPDASVVASVQMRGICTLVEDREEHKYSMECQFGKIGYGFSRLLGLHKQPALRIDVISAVWSDPASQQPPAAIDYRRPAQS